MYHFNFVLFFVALAVLFSGLGPALTSGNMQMTLFSAGGLILCGLVYLGANWFAKKHGLDD